MTVPSSSRILRRLPAWGSAVRPGAFLFIHGEFIIKKKNGISVKIGRCFISLLLARDVCVDELTSM